MEGKFKFPYKIYVLILYIINIIILKIYFFLSCFCSAHTECIVAEDSEVAEAFLSQVDR